MVEEITRVGSCFVFYFLQIDYKAYNYISRHTTKQYRYFSLFLSVYLQALCALLDRIDNIDVEGDEK